MNSPKRNPAGRRDEREIFATRGHQAHVLFGLRQQGRFIKNFALDFLASARSSGFNEAELKVIFNSCLDEPLGPAE
ncbi:MAG: hypothetical protein ACRC6N_13340, partial [Plesiomonas sp.]